MSDQLPIRNAEKAQDHTISGAMGCKANKHGCAILVWRFSSLLWFLRLTIFKYWFERQNFIQLLRPLIALSSWKVFSILWISVFDQTGWITSHQNILLSICRPGHPKIFKYRNRNLYSKPLKLYDICNRLILGGMARYLTLEKRRFQLPDVSWSFRRFQYLASSRKNHGVRKAIGWFGYPEMGLESVIDLQVISFARRQAITIYRIWSRFIQTIQKMH